MKRKNNSKKIAILVIATVLMSGCSREVVKFTAPVLDPVVKASASVSAMIPDMDFLTLYKSDVNQGSVLSLDDVKELKKGMTKSEVKRIVGSPSIIDPFHRDEWEYINHSTLHKKEDIKYRMTLTFEGEVLIKIDTSKLKQLSD
jgi:outer membrane protein assembly factor BamE